MKSVLIIEDNKEIALQMEKYLVNNGYEIELASSFYEATYKMNVDIDVALLDINLPDKDGQYLIEKLKDKDIQDIKRSHSLFMEGEANIAHINHAVKVAEKHLCGLEHAMKSLDCALTVVKERNATNGNVFESLKAKGVPRIR